jgi:hypothetical protein
MSYGKKRVHNIATGEIIEVPLTVEEITIRDAERATSEATDALRQQEALARETDLRDVRGAQVEAALTQIDNQIQAVISNDADVSSASTLAALRPVLRAMLAREQATLQRERQIIRALWRLVE